MPFKAERHRAIRRFRRLLAFEPRGNDGGGKVPLSTLGFPGVAPETKRGPALLVLADKPWDTRLAVVRDTHFLGGVASVRHDVMFKAPEKLDAQSATEPVTNEGATGGEPS